MCVQGGSIEYVSPVSTAQDISTERDCSIDSALMMSHCLLNNTHMRKHCLASSISLSISDAIPEYAKAITNLFTLTMQYFRQSLCTSVSILHEILQLLYKLIQTQKPQKVSENNW